MKRAEYILSVVLVAIACYVLYESCRFPEALVGDTQLGESFWPRVLAIILIGLALLQAYQSWKREPQANDHAGLFTKGGVPLCVMALLIAFVFALEPLGFILATTGLNYALLLLLRVRTPIGLLVFPPALTLITYYIFAKLLLVPLPEGILYF